MIMKTKKAIVTSFIIVIVLLSSPFLFKKYFNDNNDHYFLEVSQDNKKDLLLTQADVEIETIHIEPAGCSYIGHLDMISDTIYFIDSRFCKVFSFDLDGKLLKEELGQGGGPNEINTALISGYVKLPNGNWVFIGTANDCHIFSSNFEKIKTYVIDKYYNESESYDSPLKYSLCYPKLKIVPYEESFIYNTYTEAPSLNFYDNKEKYFKNCRILTKVDANTGKVVDHFGRFSPIYNKSDKDLRLTSLVDFDIDSSGNYYITYEADSLIYLYDKDFNVRKAFGYQGQNMEYSYPELTFEEFSHRYEIERANTSYYSSIKYVDALDVLFRVYTISKDDKNDGLQIYNNEVLIGDINIPKTCKILGYTYPYLYMSPSIDVDSDIMTIYRFKL